LNHTHQPSIFTVGMNWRISRRFYLQPSLLVINIRRPSLLSATLSPLSPVYSDGGYATSLFIRSDSLVREIWIRWFERLLCQHYTIDSYSTLREIWIHCYNRFSIWITHQPPIFTVGMNSRISRRFYFQLFFLVDKHPPGVPPRDDGNLCLLYTSTVHFYSPRLRRRFRRSILTAVMRPSPFYTFGFVTSRDLDSLL
jgi:hypothetical protein